MDAIDAGVGNEALPTPRRLGLILMGKNALAVDLVACRLLGLRGETKVPYLTAIIKRGYKPGRVEDVTLMGDATSVADLDKFGERVKPYDDEFYRWQDCNKEFARMNSPLKLLHGPYSEFTDEKCETGCVMGIKMYMAFLEAFAGVEAFKNAKPTVFIIGNIKDEVDAQGGPVFMFGSCAKANIKNAKYVSKIEKCFVTAADMILLVGNRTGIKSPFMDPKFLGQMVPAVLGGAVRKTLNGRYAQDVGDFVMQHLFRRL
jgi:hypothetical protein